MPPTDSSPHLYTALSAPAAPPALLRLVPSLLATLLPGSLDSLPVQPELRGRLLWPHPSL